jgi:hypothetical protein
MFLKGVAMLFLKMLLMECAIVVGADEVAYVRQFALTLKGSANGGTLVLGNTLNRNASFVAIQTEEGEPAELVTEHLALAVVSSNSLFDWPHNLDRGERVSRILVDNSIKLPGYPGMYFLAGTETSLGIPEPPLFLSATYDRDADTLVFTWVNYDQDYDALILRLRWKNYDSGHRQQLPGSLTSWTIDRGKVPVDLDDVDCWLVAIRDGIPSSPAAIRVSSQGAAQDELFGIPFTRGVAPNWKSWSTGCTDDMRGIVSSERPGLAPTPGKRYNPAKEPSKKPFVQLLKTPAGGGTVGVHRRFLGLRPGHTYRLTTRMNTLAMDPNDTTWSYSLHMTPHGPRDEVLNAQHFAGTRALPNQQIGPAAGRVAEYRRSTTQKEYIKQSGELTLPTGADSITVWLRYSSTKETTGVSLDWIKLEDLTMQGQPDR